MTDKAKMVEDFITQTGLNLDSFNKPIMPKLGIIRLLIEHISQDEIVTFLDLFKCQPPDVTGQSYASWAVSCMEKLNMSQTDLATMMAWRPEKINRFLNGKRPLPDEDLLGLKDKLLEVLASKGLLMGASISK